MDPATLDDIIGRLVEVRSARPGKQVQLSESEIKQLCVASRDIFLQQPNLLELEAPIKICGKAFILLLGLVLEFSCSLVLLLWRISCLLDSYILGYSRGDSKLLSEDVLKSSSFRGVSASLGSW